MGGGDLPPDEVQYRRPDSAKERIKAFLEVSFNKYDCPHG